MKVTFIYSAFESLGIEYLSAVLKKAGHKTSLVFCPRLFEEDASTYNRVLSTIFTMGKEVANKAIESNPNLIAFSATTDTYGWARRVAEEIKKKTNIPIVFGGIHVTLVPQQVIENDCVDYIVIGEGEGAMLDLVDSLEQEKLNGDIKNIWFKNDGKIIRNDVRDLISNLDKIPFPDKELYSKGYTDFSGSYRTIASRGCPFSCSYCYNSVIKEFYKKRGAYRRIRNVENVIEELKFAKQKYKVSSVIFYDDLFPYNTDWLASFAEAYKKNINLPFWCYVHPNTFTKETADMLDFAGCAFVAMGFDTVDREFNRRILNRNVSKKQMENAIKILRNTKINLHGGYLLGLPGQRSDQVIKDIDFFNKNKVDSISVFWIGYYPGCKIREIALDKESLTNNGIEGSGKLATTLRLRKNVKRGDMARIAHLFYLTCLLPRELIHIIVKKRLYRFFPTTNLRFAFLSLLEIKHYLKSRLGYKRNLARFLHRYRFYLYYIKFKLLKTLKNNFNRITNEVR